MSTNAMHVAKTGLNAQQVRMQVIANNLSNVNTTGFKRDRANFETLLYQVIRNSGDQTSAETNLNSAFAVGTGTRIVNSDKLFSQGNIVSTDNALDISIDGGGFFQVLMPDGRVGYTRNGAFSRNAEGLLTTSSGYLFSQKYKYLWKLHKLTFQLMELSVFKCLELLKLKRLDKCNWLTFLTEEGFSLLVSHF